MVGLEDEEEATRSLRSLTVAKGGDFQTMSAASCRALCRRTQRGQLKESGRNPGGWTGPEHQLGDFKQSVNNGTRRPVPTVTSSCPGTPSRHIRVHKAWRTWSPANTASRPSGIRTRSAATSGDSTSGQGAHWSRPPWQGHRGLR